jgi:hypothetical protein
LHKGGESRGRGRAGAELLHSRRQPVRRHTEYGSPSAAETPQPRSAFRSWRRRAAALPKLPPSRAVRIVELVWLADTATHSALVEPEETTVGGAVGARRHCDGHL